MIARIFDKVSHSNSPLSPGTNYLSKLQFATTVFAVSADVDIDGVISIQSELKSNLIFLLRFSILSQTLNSLARSSRLHIVQSCPFQRYWASFSIRASFSTTYLWKHSRQYYVIDWCLPSSHQSMT